MDRSTGTEATAPAGTADVGHRVAPWAAIAALAVAGVSFALLPPIFPHDSALPGMAGRGGDGGHRMGGVAPVRHAGADHAAARRRRGAPDA